MKKLPIFFAILFIVLVVAGIITLMREGSNFFRSRAANNVVEQMDWEDQAVRTEEETTWRNTYLGFSYTIPKDWWLYDMNEENFSPDPLSTVNPEILDIIYGTDAGYYYSYIELGYFANLRDSRRDNHIGYYISAEALEGVSSLADYMEYLEEYLLRPDEDEYDLLDSGTEVINGVQWEKRYVEVIRETSANFIYLTYTRPMRDNYYLTIKTSYWPQNRNAETFITGSLTRAMQ